MEIPDGIRTWMYYYEEHKNLVRSSYGSTTKPIVRPHAIAISIENLTFQWKSRWHAAVRWAWGAAMAYWGAA